MFSHLHKHVTKENWLAETKTDLFSHHTMRLESHVVDAFREGEGPGVLGRMLDILEGHGHAVGATAVNSRATIIDGSPTTGRLVDIMPTAGMSKVHDRDFLRRGENQQLRSFLEAIYADSDDNSGLFGNVWSQTFVDTWNSECHAKYDLLLLWVLLFFISSHFVGYVIIRNGFSCGNITRH